MSDLERALRDLEIATTTVSEISLADLEAVKGALDGRSQAVAQLAELTRAPFTLEESEREDALLRLRLACQSGAQAQQRLAAISRAALAEWRQWSQIYRTLGASREPDPVLDCRG